MKKVTMFACVAMTLVFALSSVAGELPALSDGHNSVLYGGSSFVKASGDTIDVMGPSGTYQGNFENAACDASKGLPVGWNSYDITQPTITHWSVSTINNDIAGINGNSMWCGDFIDACVAADSAWGYGNAWHDIVEFRKTVANPGVSTTVTVTATLFHDSEPGYDYTYLSYKMADAPYADLQSWDGAGTVAVSNSVTYLPGEYENGNEVVIMFRFKSDGGWSDSDCSWPTRGAANVDDVTVTVGATPYFDDFEAKGFGNWATTFPNGVGDYAQIWCGLEDVDPCNTNYSNQVAFIDDGLVVPGTNGSTCINWCYGPAGFIVTTTGGLAGPNEHLYNALESPVMPWPNATYDGMIMAFNAYRHEDLTADAPGIFYTWSVRSADTDNSAGNGAQVIADMPWLDRNFVYYGGPDYIRVINNVTDLMEAGRDEIQLQTTAYELGYAWGWDGDDGYPAPYFDNFNVKVFPVNGPSIVTRELDIANDNFPEIGVIDTGNLGAHSVRFDMANNISLASHLRNDPGDTIVFDVVPVRSGSVLSGTPTLHWTMDQNTLFNPYRTSVYGTATSGTSLGTPAVGASGIPDPDAWAFDLPDTGFFFPGDVIHYYIEAFDDVSGDIKAATSPADLTGYGDFSHPLAYNSSYVVHALPTLESDGFGGYKQPGLLFLNDFANRGGEAEWYGAFDNIGLLAGRDYDIYYTNGPSSGVGNGIGGRAAIGTISGYGDIVYTVGDLGVNTIANGDFDNDAGDDVGLLTQWLDLGGKDMFLTGDDLASDLAQAGTATLNFLQNYMGLSVFSNDVRPLIGGQATPTVKAIAGNGVITNISTWVAYGGCFGINTFDAVTVTGGATRLAEFLDPNGLAGAYTYSAATKKALVNSSRIVSTPYDFMFIYDDPGAKAPAPLSARAQVLKDVLSHFGIDSNPGDVSDVPDAVAFSSKNYPNPFNPTTKIEFTMPKAGHLTLKIYNVRGELVRTLIDEVRAAGTDHVMWDGTSDLGSSVSSGVYFYEARYGDEVQVQKMALVK
ncbi:MAG: FlgD immunoglobulin-like domain containing protein [bacterium]